MINKLAERILGLIRQGQGLSQYEVNHPSIELSKIVRIIASECNCSLIDDNGNYIRYGSSIDIDTVEKIILNLLCEENTIPSEITSKALVKEGIKGSNVDIIFQKKYNTVTKNIELEMIPIMPENFEKYLGKNNSEIQSKLIDEVLKPYVKEIIFSNETLIKKSPIGAFISRSLFRKRTPRALKQAYIRILQKYIKNGNKYQIKNFVNYIVDNVLQNTMFKKELINSSINSVELQVLGRVYTGFNGLVYNMITTTLSMLTLKESPNKELLQIQDIFYTTIAVLTTLATDITSLDENQIEIMLKIINKDYNINSDNLRMAIPTYRNIIINKDLYGNELLFVKPQEIEKAMKNLCARIRAVIINKDKITTDDFIKEVMRINYRFIRIQPFKSANGRTSRALINMLLQAKGMSAYFEKNIRNEYIKSITQAHEILNKYQDQYNYNLVNNPAECAKYEEQYLQRKIPILIVKD